MVLSEINVYKQVLGSLMKKPVLLIEYPDIGLKDFDTRLTKIVFSVIYNMFKQGATSFEPIDVDFGMNSHDAAKVIYDREQGLEFVKDCFTVAKVENFDYNYNRMKKLALLRELKKQSYDISDFWKENFDTMREEEEAIERFENASLDEIFSSVESKFNAIKSDFVNGGRHDGDSTTGLKDMVEGFKKSPEIGPSLCGKFFSTACRGARPGKFYLRSAQSSTGKSRLATFDACKIAYPIHWSFKKGTFVMDVDDMGRMCEPNKVLFITTEMAKEEIQTIVLAHLSGVNEAHILTGRYEVGEEKRVMYAIEIMERYKEYFYIDEISDPNLTNVEAMIKRYATVEEVQYVFFDYIFSSPSLIAQFSGSKIREDSDVLLHYFTNFVGVRIAG